MQILLFIVQLFNPVVHSLMSVLHCKPSQPTSHMHVPLTLSHDSVLMLQEQLWVQSFPYVYGGHSEDINFVSLKKKNKTVFYHMKLIILVRGMQQTHTGDISFINIAKGNTTRFYWLCFQDLIMDCENYKLNITTLNSTHIVIHHVHALKILGCREICLYLSVNLWRVAA